MEQPTTTEGEAVADQSGSSDGTSADQIIAGIQDGSLTAEEERRGGERHPYSGRVAIVLINEDKQLSMPMVYQGVDISGGGLCIQSRGMLHTGTVGAVQLRKSSGDLVVIGVRVCHCRYVEKGMHHIGLAFIETPTSINRKVFNDTNGRSVLESA